MFAAPQHPWAEAPGAAAGLSIGEAARVMRRCTRDLRRQLYGGGSAAAAAADVVGVTFAQLQALAEAMTAEAKRAPQAAVAAGGGGSGGVAGGAALGGTGLCGTASGNTASGNTASGNTASGNTASGGAALGGPPPRSVFLQSPLSGLGQLHPAFLRVPGRGVRAQLCAHSLLRYAPELRAFWLGYAAGSVRNAEAGGAVGFVSDAEPLAIVNFKVALDGLLFRPAKGSLILGRVQQVRHTHISLLVLGLFHATVRRRHMDAFFTFEDDVYTDMAGTAIESGTTDVAFRVLAVEWRGSDVVTIDGAAASGCLGPLDAPPGRQHLWSRA